MVSFSSNSFAGSDARCVLINIYVTIRLPYDWKNPIGYLVALYLEWLYATYLFQYVACFVFLAFGVFMHAISFVEDMKRKLHSINEMAGDENSHKCMYPKLSRFIHLHAKAKQLSEVIYAI